MIATATILTRNGSYFTLDATTTENHERTLTATSNPIECGAMIADHAILQPATFTLIGVMVDVNTTRNSITALANNLFEYVKNPDFVNDITVPGTLRSITDQTVDYVNRSIDLIASSASSLIDGASNENRALAPWLPTFYPGGSVDISDSDQRVAQAYDQLFSLQKSALPVTVLTSSAIYLNMLITSIKVDIDSVQGGATFTLTLKEVFIVDTQNTAMNNNEDSLTIGTTGGRTASQTAELRNAGEITLTASTLSDLLERGNG
ncbi:hypothetical protein MUU49_17465 [Scandinavium goeteborgense]|uniref:phage baseplate protein n=1 Tax=Scandinavium goeteborgense TaxID=1851514 RepID=UPI0021653FFF|nr:hypothetical protein [Scandinavium goeteborgense]MCS2154347.1 hypothetical protein [Scandinavium goeteborgense]